MQYLTIDEIKQAFAEHLIQYAGYSEEWAKVAVSDFPDPYSNCYLNEKHIDDCEIDGIIYEQNATRAVLWSIGLEGTPTFCFYTYYRKEDIKRHSATQYRKARKLFQIEGLSKEDFPAEEVEK